MYLKVSSHCCFIRGVLTPKILSDYIWIFGYFGQPLTYPYFIIFSFAFV
jgi:hypothetical protein